MSVRIPPASEHQQVFTQKLAQLNLDRIAQKLMHPEHGMQWPAHQTEWAIARYKQFLCLLYLYPNCSIVPTQEIDQVWHTHILDTHKYAQDCQWLFGYFVHHYPYFGMDGESGQQQLETAFAQTCLLFNQHFQVDLRERNPYQSFACHTIPLRELQRPSACIELSHPHHTGVQLNYSAKNLFHAS